jgi:hypothetical protein
MMDDEGETQNMKRDQTGVIPDLYTDTIIDSCLVAQLTWALVLDAAPRPVTLDIAH